MGRRRTARRVAPPSESGNRAPTLLVVPALLAATVLVAAVEGPWHVTGSRRLWRLFTDVRLPTPEQPERPQDGGPVVAPTPSPTSTLLVGVFRVVIVLVVVIAAAWLGRRLLAVLRRRLAAPGRAASASELSRTVERTDEVDLPRLREAVERAERELRGDVAPADAVVAAWVAVERAAARSGVTREPSATATELTVSVLDRTRADPAAIRGLLELYLTARFSAHPVTPVHVERARDALAALGDGLARRRGSDSDAGTGTGVETCSDGPTA